MSIPPPERPFSPSPPRENRHSASRPPSLLFGAPPPTVAPSSTFSLSGLPPSPSSPGPRAGLGVSYAAPASATGTLDSPRGIDIAWRAVKRSPSGDVHGEFYRGIPVTRRSSADSTTSSSSPPLGATSLLAALASPDKAPNGGGTVPSPHRSAVAPHTPPLSARRVSGFEPESAPFAPASPSSATASVSRPRSAGASSVDDLSPRHARSTSATTLSSHKSLPRLHQPTVVRSASGRGIKWIPPPAHSPSASSPAGAAAPRAHGHFNAATTAAAVTATAIAAAAVSSPNRRRAGTVSSARRTSVASESSTTPRVELHDVDRMVQTGTIGVAQGAYDPHKDSEEITYTEPPESEAIVEPPPVDEARASGIAHEIEAHGTGVDVVDIPEEELEDARRELEDRAKEHIVQGPAVARKGNVEHLARQATRPAPDGKEEDTGHADITRNEEAVESTHKRPLAPPAATPRREAGRASSSYLRELGQPISTRPTAEPTLSRLRIIDSGKAVRVVDSPTPQGHTAVVEGQLEREQALAGTAVEGAEEPRVRSGEHQPELVRTVDEDVFGDVTLTMPGAFEGHADLMQRDAETAERGGRAWGGEGAPGPSAIDPSRASSACEAESSGQGSPEPALHEVDRAKAEDELVAKPAGHHPPSLVHQLNEGPHPQKNEDPQVAGKATAGKDVRDAAGALLIAGARGERAGEDGTARPAGQAGDEAGKDGQLDSGKTPYVPPYTPRAVRLRPFTFHHAPAPDLSPSPAASHGGAGPGASPASEHRTAALVVHATVGRASSALPFTHRRLELSVDWAAPAPALAWVERVPGARLVPGLGALVRRVPALALCPVNTPVEYRTGYVGVVVRAVVGRLPGVGWVADWL
ncbi:hypothetical protein Q5752_006398 [Cryptotrichosporon argae]